MRTDSDTIKVRPDGFRGSFFAHVEYEVENGVRTKPVAVSFSCQPKHEGTDLGKAIEAMNKRVEIFEGVAILKPRLTAFLMPESVSDAHVVVFELLKAANKLLTEEMKERG